MKLHSRILLVCMAALMLNTGYAQQSDAMAELEKIKSYYAGNELKHVTGKMFLKELNSGKQIDKVEFEYWASDKKLFAKMSYIEVLSNDKIYVMVNAKRKTIYAREQSDIGQQPGIGFFDPTQLNKLLATKGAKFTITKSPNANKLAMTGLAQSKFSSLTITYLSDYKIIAVDAIVNNDQPDGQKLALEIRYTNTEKSSLSSSPAVFLESKYIAKNNKGKYTYTATYQNYQKL